MRGRVQEAIAVLALGVLAAALFRLYPALDLKTSAFFNAGPRDFWPIGNPVLRYVRAVGEAIPIVAVTALGGLAALQLLWPRARRLISMKATLFLGLTLALGPGLTTNVLLKDRWGRPRPADIVEFGGNATYVKPWTPSDQCRKNCSFVSGEASGAFWLMSLAPLLPGAYGTAALAAGALAGLVIGGVRVAYGGHFLSDVLFAGFVTFGVIWLVHAWLYRFRPAWAEDAAIEARLGRIKRFSANATWSLFAGAKTRRTKQSGALSDAIKSESAPARALRPRKGPGTRVAGPLPCRRTEGPT